MFKIGIKYNNVIITSKEFNEKDLYSIPDKSFLSYILKMFNDIYKIDIGKYRLNEYELNLGEFILLIRDEDLQKIRDMKLKDLGL
jgi:hypothetical protein